MKTVMGKVEVHVADPVTTRVSGTGGYTRFVDADTARAMVSEGRAKHADDPRPTASLPFNEDGSRRSE